MNSVLIDHEFVNNIFKFNPELFSNFSRNQTFEETFQNLDLINLDNISYDQNHLDISPEIPRNDLSKEINYTLPYQQSETNIISPQVPYFVDDQQNGNKINIISEIPDFPDDCLKFMSDILLEEGLDHNSSLPQEFSLTALEATEKSLYEALGEQYPYPNPYPNPYPDSSSNPSPSSSPSSLDQINVSSPDEETKQVKTTRRKKGRKRDESDNIGRILKIQATTNEDYNEMEKYDDVLLCSEYENNNFTNFSPNDSKKATRVVKNQIIQRDEVDLRTLLTQCAQAVSNFDLKTSNELLKQIRHHATPYGDSIQRLAHHMACGLEARLAGTGSTMSTDIVDARISTPDFLKAYKMYVSAIPFKRMSYFVANSTILKLAEKATKIHIIDFGIFLGLQWPCLIKRLSKLPNGPPTLRITGIDFPQQGFRPTERIDATGRRLSGYCGRFGVPFEYNGIADKWENIKPEDIKIDNDELVIVNCMYRSGTLLDETVDTSSPRDTFLRLVRNLKPDLFVHGVINGTFNAPFFTTRFREALYHYSSVFEVFEATLPRESRERLLIESEGYGKEVHNLVACEGIERIQRPESYKQWQVRQARAGLRRVAFDRELVGRAKAMVKGNYHGDFLVDEDKHWMLQGWKGRIFCALSFWRPSL